MWRGGVAELARDLQDWDIGFRQQLKRAFDAHTCQDVPVACSSLAEMSLYRPRSERKLAGKTLDIGLAAEQTQPQGLGDLVDEAASKLRIEIDSLPATRRRRSAIVTARLAGGASRGVVKRSRCSTTARSGWPKTTGHWNRSSHAPASPGRGKSTSTRIGCHVAPVKARTKLIIADAAQAA